MGRPLSRQQFFGANENNNIKAQFNNGSSSVRGYILKQKASTRFLCVDENGNQALCYLKVKSSADLQPGEMSITVLDDDGVSHQITKITRHRVSFNGSSAAWTFDADLSDGFVQMEEAGTDGAMTDAVDLEGDDVIIPAGMDRNEPWPGTGGTNRNVPGVFAPIDSVVGPFSSVGIAFRNISASALDTVPNSANGLYRRKYVGNFSTAYVKDTIPPYTLDMGFFGDRSHGPISEPAYEVDTYLSFGSRGDLGNENNYAFEWKGYMQAPVTGNMRIGALVDDDCVLWIGAPALTPLNNNYLFAQTGNDDRSGTDGVTVVAGKWYPVRIWFQEWSGAELFQLGASNSVNATKYGIGAGGTPFTVAYNTATTGY
jgi:hypothetical protein